MVAEDASSTTELYSKLDAEKQADFNKVVIKKLKTLIGGCGELSVLAEYIAVMLQSSRPPEQIQSELEAFLQDQSVAFTDWLFKQLAKHGGLEEARAAPAGAVVRAPDAKGEALLLRAVQDARQGVAAQTEVPAKRKERREKEVPEKDHKSSTRNRHQRSRSRRERSRPRRRRAEAAAQEASAVDKKAVLTPNVRFLRDAYHQNKGVDEAVERPAGQEEPRVDTRWSFRAEAAPITWQGAAPTGPPSAVITPAPHGHPPPHAVAPGYGVPPVHGATPYDHPAAASAYGAAGPVVVPISTPAPRPRFFQIRKWKVARQNTVVRASEQLNSPEVQTLQVGEIVEQVAPPFKLQNGIVRIQVRHPSSPHFPNPIGWVTLDATAAGGPKFLEPGPEPMQKPSWRPPAPAWAAPVFFRPRAPAGGMSPAKPARAPGTFQNLTWTPGGGKNAGEAITISG